MGTGRLAGSILVAVLSARLAAPVCAQVRREIDPREQKRLDDLPPCPFEHVSLSATDPAAVAWAATLLTNADCQKSTVAASLLTAMRAMRAGNTPEHQAAVLQLLHVALENGVTIPTEDLRFPIEGRARIPWIALRVRAATHDGSELFALFHELDATTDAGWEVVGGSLAIRGHRAFAAELRTQMTPRLRIHIGWRPQDEHEPRMGIEALPMLQDFPPRPTYYWDRDKFSIVSPTFTLAETWNHSTECKVNALRTERAQLRWLAQLAGEYDPVAWAARFDAEFRDRDIRNFEAFAEGAEKRTKDSLAKVDAALRERLKLPERLKFPPLVVEWEDLRRDKDKEGQPMPVRKEAR